MPVRCIIIPIVAPVCVPTAMISRKQRLYLPLKRIIDVFCALAALLLFGWVYIVIAIIIKCTSRGPVLFKQERIGKNKKHFVIHKFRTMRSNTNPNIPTHLLENPEAHITKIGGFLRKTSLDEIPQAFDILAGHMSVIGPRPALWNQDDLIAERDKYGANDIRPGLSGWAQIHGRDELEIAEKAKLDGEYVRRFGFLFDARIVILSVFKGFTGKNEKEGKR